MFSYCLRCRHNTESKNPKCLRTKTEETQSIRNLSI